MYRDTINNMTDDQLDRLREQNDINQTADVYEIADILGLFECAEDDILDTFINGGYTMGAEQMLEHDINPNRLVNWLLDQREEYGEVYYTDIDLSAVVSIVGRYNEVRNLLTKGV